ncbi:uncharacterized protein LOC114526355 [Dendronephthya gigantea]|uniref:uncharacterized protein LOC114526355 n=1 Tax=Dendronephthya gigantea TaxID=151771 RepID=UPI0010694939|nr:uncharacterized protein LOC114526355 [Dendronephthya gigantea]
MASNNSGAWPLLLLLYLGLFLALFLLRSSSNKPSCEVTIEANSKQIFIRQASRQNVELLYLRLKFLNESLSNTERLFSVSDISTIYDPMGWVWTDNDHGKAILSLPYDYSILSMTTLARETGKLELRMITNPPGCLSEQQGHNQLTSVRETLAETAKVMSSNSLICHRFVRNIQTDIKIIYESTFASGLPVIQYKCCPVHDLDGGCSMVIVPNTALSFILRVIWVASCAVAFLTPLLIKYLPYDNTDSRRQMYESKSESISLELDSPGSHVNDIPVEDGGESTELNVDVTNEDEYLGLDASTPLTVLWLSKTGALLCLKARPRWSRFLLFSILIPAVLIASLILYSFLLQLDVDLQKQAEIKTDFMQMCLNPDVFLIIRIAAYIFSCLMLCIPLNISDVVDESLILIGDLQIEKSCCVICTAMNEQPDMRMTGVRLLCDNMCRHLRFLFTTRFWKLLLSFCSFPSRWLLRFLSSGRKLPVAEIWQTELSVANRNDVYLCRKIIGTTIWLLLSPVWLTAFLIVTIVIFCFMIPIGYFLACISLVPLVYLVQKFGNGVCTWFIFIVCFCINILSAIFLIEVITFSWNFVLKLVSFTIMGLVLGIDYYIPYIVYAVAIFYYVRNTLCNLNDKYLKLKVSLFNECQKQQKSRGDTPLLFVKNKKTEMPMIPKELFEIACNKYIPVKKTIASSILTLVMIICFITFAFVSVMAFGKWAKVPSITEAVVTFAISTLPKMLRESSKHTGWSSLKEKERSYSLELDVVQFVRKHKNMQSNVDTNDGP